MLSHPNGRFRPVEIAGEASDDDEIEDVYLASVESSDPGEARDIAGARIGSFDEVLLRPSALSSGERRTYRIMYVAVDATGNETRATATVACRRASEPAARRDRLRAGASARRRGGA